MSNISSSLSSTILSFNSYLETIQKTNSNYSAVITEYVERLGNLISVFYPPVQGENTLLLNSVEKAFWYIAERELLRLQENLEDVVLHNKSLDVVFKELNEFIGIMNERANSDDFSKLMDLIDSLAHSDPTILLINYPTAALAILVNKVFNKNTEQKIFPFISFVKDVLALFPFKIEIPNIKSLLKEILKAENRYFEVEEGSFVLRDPIPELFRKYKTYLADENGGSVVDFLRVEGYQEEEIAVLKKIFND